MTDSNARNSIGYVGHFNVLKRDHDSYVTGFGLHDRVLATFPRDGELYMRVDHKWGLGMPSKKQLLKVAQESGISTRGYTEMLLEPWSDGSSTDVFFYKKDFKND